MTKRIFRSICLVAVVVLLASFMLIMGVLYDYFSNNQMSQLKAQAQLAAQGVEQSGADYFSGLDDTGFRVTWISADGTVLYDSDAEAGSMENHHEREEVREALETGSGESMRYSTTLMERQLYAAERLSDGTVIRLSGAQYTVLTLVLSMLQPLIVIAAAALGLSLWLASRLSKRIVKPLNELDPDEPEKLDAYEELRPLTEKLCSQQHQLKAQAEELQRKRDEFEAASGNMIEGLVLLNEQGSVLSINRAATRLLGISRCCIGRDMPLPEGLPEMRELLQKALRGEHGEISVHIDGGSYQIYASPVISNEKIAGAVLLFIDISEKESAEQMRREFTANVSHELKTPLHTISGCAELLANGMVKQEDVPRFSLQIQSEAKRMITLVEDIIKLSHLDEGAEDMRREQTDLYRLAMDTVRSLTPAAREAGVSLELSGESAVIIGVPQLLDGIIHNLCDNAIKYNRRGGSVAVTVTDGPDTVRLTVKDNGIGIPPEQQERIFERFYRVDKSHSKEVGGTGLGLSIVKHAAKLHNAPIGIHSVPGEGTEITVDFPK